MPGVRCSVRHCANSVTAQKKLLSDQLEIKFHACPKSHELRRKWIQSCGRLEPNWNPQHFRVCSVHFTSSDYNAPGKLKQTAIPSLHCYSTTPLGTNATLSTPQSQLSPQSSLPFKFHTAIEGETEACLPVGTEECDLPGSYRTASSQEEELRQLRACNQELIQKNLDLETALLQANSRAREAEGKVHCLKEQLKQYKKQGKASKQKIKEEIYKILEFYFTRKQIDMIINKKKKVHWTDDEISIAFTLRYMSKRAYIFMRSTLHYPLPGISSLQRWASQLDMRQGLQHHVLRVMRSVAHSFKPAERVAVVTFDEMKVESKREYDQRNDDVIGCHSQMQVVMVRGLFAKWKQVVYADFDTKMTKDILLKIIMELYNAGYTVRACTSDMGGGNQGLWKELGITENKSWIQHPNTDKKIFFFADAPHALKLIRNWFLDTGFILEDGTEITKAPLEELVKIRVNGTNPSEVTSCFKITNLHLEVTKAQRQNVRLAAQLLSHTVAEALKMYLPGEDQMAALNLSKCIETINSWYDINNSYVPLDTPYKSGYGMHLQDQDDALGKMYRFISTMKCRGKSDSLQVFQKGILFSIRSLQELRREMEEEFGKTYILTHRLNQDCLENFFCQLRSRGGLHDHPSPLQALFRLRMIMLGKNPGIVQKNANTMDARKLDDDEFIMASFIRRTGLNAPQEYDTSSINAESEEDEVEKEGEEDEQDKENEDQSSKSKEVNIRKEMERDGLEYLAGWTASKHPEIIWLGQRTANLPPTMEAFKRSTPPWIQRLSFGGLYQPSEKWCDRVNTMEKMFQKYHEEDGLYKGPYVVRKLVVQVCSKLTDVPRNVAETFLRQRTRIRITYLNYTDDLKEKQKRAVKRKSGQQGKAESQSKDNPHPANEVPDKGNTKRRRVTKKYNKLTK